MFIIKHKNFFLGLSILLMVLSLLAFWGWGLRLGIDFTGGALLEVKYSAETRPEPAEVKNALADLDLGDIFIQPSGEDTLILKTKDLSDGGRQEVLNILSEFSSAENEMTVERFTSIGPVIGSELRHKSWIAILTVIVFIILFIAFAFRHVSAPVASWKYGLAAVLALSHDVLIPTGVMVLLGKFAGIEADILFVTALLAILGFSVHDTIVVFDRVRENLKHRAGQTFKEPVGKSVEETFARSINTSLTTLVVLLALYIFGGESTQVFALVLSIGIISGTYSSLFLACPALTFIEEKQS